MEVLKFAKITSIENIGIKFQTTNLTIYQTESINVSDLSEGTILINLKTFKDIVSKFNDESIITIRKDNDKDEVNIECVNSKFKLKNYSVNEFPNFNDIEEFETIKIPCHSFYKFLKNMRFTMSTEETRYYLNGIYFDFKNDILNLVATNGHILCLNSIQLDKEYENISML